MCLGTNVARRRLSHRQGAATKYKHMYVQKEVNLFSSFAVFRLSMGDYRLTRSDSKKCARDEKQERDEKLM